MSITKRSEHANEPAEVKQPWLSTERAVLYEAALTTFFAIAAKSLFVTHEIGASPADFALFPVALMVPRFEYELDANGTVKKRAWGDSALLGAGALAVQLTMPDKRAPGYMAALATGLCAMAAHATARYVGMTMFSTHHKVYSRHFQQ